mmetsp:Transcript_2449/g.7238  ORF Transcript_2449/g.7238 Transcript_2449/m.7238 type:complete len:230 (+) Transcript_2449:345-1034(+)
MARAEDAKVAGSYAYASTPVMKTAPEAAALAATWSRSTLAWRARGASAGSAASRAAASSASAPSVAGRLPRAVATDNAATNAATWSRPVGAVLAIATTAATSWAVHENARLTTAWPPRPSARSASGSADAASAGVTAALSAAARADATVLHSSEALVLTSNLAPATSDQRPSAAAAAASPLASRRCSARHLASGRHAARRASASDAARVASCDATSTNVSRSATRSSMG